MEPADQSHLDVMAKAYNAVASDYAAFVEGGLSSRPVEYSVLAAFAGLVRQAGPAPVADLGCGPGYIAGHLHDMGIDVFGVDLSAALIERARKLFPDLRFSVGSMIELPEAGGSLGGIVSWYSIIHALPAEIPAYLTEFRNLLRSGGYLLIAFFESEGGPVAPFDHAVTVAYRWPVDSLSGIAESVGFCEVARLMRKPFGGERFERGHLFLRKM